MYGHHFSHFDVEKGEFVCPFCKRLFNCVLPLLPPLQKKKEEDAKAAVIKSDQSFAQWSQEMRTLALDAVNFIGILFIYDTLDLKHDTILQMKLLPEGTSFELPEVIRAVDASSLVLPSIGRKVELSISMVSMVDTFSLNLFSVRIVQKNFYTGA